MEENRITDSCCVLWVREWHEWKVLFSYYLFCKTFPHTRSARPILLIFIIQFRTTTITTTTTSTLISYLYSTKCKCFLTIGRFKQNSPKKRKKLIFYEENGPQSHMQLNDMMIQSLFSNQRSIQVITKRLLYRSKMCSLHEHLSYVSITS